MDIFLKLLFYWAFIPATVLFAFRFSFPYPFCYWGVFLVVFGIFWSLLSTSYLLVVGNGIPFFGKHSPKILVKCGPYSMSRHPIYFGYFVYTVGLAVLFDLPALIFVPVELMLIFILIRFEEKRLNKKFEEFKEYKAKTPIFIPLKKWKIDEAKDPPFLFVFLYMIGKFLIRFFYDVRAVGKENIPTPPYLMVSNHNSYFDPFYIMDAMNVYMKAPLSWAHYDRMKWLIDHVGMFPIKRYTADSSAVLKMVRALRHGGMIGIFVENERSWDGRPLNVKNGIDRLIKTLRVPILPVRIERAHMMWPRWSPKFHKGMVRVIIGKAVPHEEYERAFKFILRDTISENEKYKDYRGIETYLWKCPKCGKISTFRSFKKGFSCASCGYTKIRPTVGEIRRTHDLNYPCDPNDLPIEDEANVNGEEMRIVLNTKGIKLGGKFIALSDVKAFLVESRKEIYLYCGELYEIHPRFTSVLMWKEWMDFLKRDDEDYWAYKR